MKKRQIIPNMIGMPANTVDLTVGKNLLKQYGLTETSIESVKNKTNEQRKQLIYNNMISPVIDLEVSTIS